MLASNSLGSRLLSILDKIQSLILISSTIIILILLGLSIVFRYILRINMFGLEELVQMAGFYLYFVGAGYSVRLGYEIKADMVDLFLTNQRKKDIVHMLAHLISIVLAFMFLYWGFSMILWGIEVNPKTPGYHLPILISYVGVELGFLFVFINTILNAYKFCFSRKNTEGICSL